MVCVTVSTAPVPNVTADFLSSGAGPNLRTSCSRNRICNIPYLCSESRFKSVLGGRSRYLPTQPLFPCIQSAGVGACLQSDGGSPGGALQAVTCRLLIFMERKVHEVTGTSLKAEGSPLIGRQQDDPGQHWLLLDAASAPILCFQDRHEHLSWTLSTHIGSMSHTSVGGLTGRVRGHLSGASVPFSYLCVSYRLAMGAQCESKGSLWEGGRGRVCPTSEIIIEYENGLMKSFLKRECVQTLSN